MKELENEPKAFYTVEYLPEKKLISTVWGGFYPTLAQVKKCALLVIEKAKENHSSKVLNDNRLLIGAWDEANEWVANVWLPLAIEAGIKKFAHILSNDLFALLSAEFMENNSKQKTTKAEFQMITFENAEEAEKWLLED